MSQQPLDDIPLLLILPGFIVATLVFYEIGYHIGQWRERQAAGSMSGNSSFEART